MHVLFDIMHAHKPLRESTYVIPNLLKQSLLGTPILKQNLLGASSPIESPTDLGPQDASPLSLKENTAPIQDSSPIISYYPSRLRQPPEYYEPCNHLTL